MGKNLGADKDISALARKAKKQGWSVEVTNSNHIRFIPPASDLTGERRTVDPNAHNAPFVSAPLTPGDHRSFLAVRAKLRRAGLKID